MNYSDIYKCDLANGPGIRVSLFVSGCQFHCLNCFNKEAQNYNYGTPYTEETEKTIYELVSNPHIAGLSILGGDPLWQTNEDIFKLISLVKKIKELNKNVWIWSGFTWNQLFNDSDAPDEDVKIMDARKLLIKSCDVFIDGRYIDELRDLRLKWRGSSNQQVIDVQKSISENKIVLFEQN